MALTQIGSGGIANVTNAANATFLTIDASEQITVASDGGAVTTSLQQGLLKSWIEGNTDATLDDSLNCSGGVDNGTGQYTYSFVNNMNSVSYAMTVSSHSPGFSEFDTSNQTASAYKVQIFNRTSTGSFVDAEHFTMCAGDLA